MWSAPSAHIAWPGAERRVAPQVAGHHQQTQLAVNPQLLVEGPDTWMIAHGRLARENPKLGGGLGGLDARLDAQLGVDGREVMADGLRRQVEPLGEIGRAHV